MNSAPAKKSNTLLVVLLVVVVGIFAIIFVVGIFAGVGIYGVRRYVSEAKASEGKVQAQALARGIVSCADANRDQGKSEVLPATARAVPATLVDVQGKKYMSDPSEWKDPSYACAGFSISAPQYFQYQWVRDRADHGTVTAMADLDGNGTPDATFEVEISCTASACSSGALVEK